MKKPKSTNVLFLRPSFTWWERIRWPRTQGVLWARLDPKAEITVFWGDMSVRIRNQHHEITSAYDGRIAGTHGKTGRPFSEPTGPLYIAAAEASGVEVKYVEGKGYHGTYTERFEL